MPLESSNALKENQEKETTRKTMEKNAKPKCNICGNYLFELPRCPGHGGGGGGGDCEEAHDNGLAKDDDHSVADTHANSNTDDVTSELAEVNAYQSTNSETTFNPYVISDLIDKGILKITNNIESGILTIQCHQHLMSPLQKNEFKKYTSTILRELEKFQEEKGISSKCHQLEHDLNGNIKLMLITLPPSVHDTFILLLVNKSLLPKHHIEQHQNVKYEEGKNHFRPNALPTQPTPENKLKDRQEEEKQKQHASIRPKLPTDIKP